jgi:hypothetical protein
MRGHELQALGFWAIVLLVPIGVGALSYRLGRLWPAQVAGAVLLVYTIAIPFLIGHKPAYCRGQPDCPDPPAQAFMLVFGWLWLGTICICATIAGIFGDDRAPDEQDATGVMPARR